MPQIEITTDQADAPVMRAMISAFARLQFTEQTRRRLLILRETTFLVTGEDPDFSRFMSEFKEWDMERFRRDAW